MRKFLVTGRMGGRGEAAYHLGDRRGSEVRGGSGGGGGCSGVREGKFEKVAREKLYIGGARVSWKYMDRASVLIWAGPKWSMTV